MRKMCYNKLTLSDNRLKYVCYLEGAVIVKVMHKRGTNKLKILFDNGRQ